jgi:hypothetical protein
VILASSLPVATARIDGFLSADGDNYQVDPRFAP